MAYYNLKKYFKFGRKRSKSGAGALALAASLKSGLAWLFGVLRGSEKRFCMAEHPRKNSLKQLLSLRFSAN